MAPTGIRTRGAIRERLFEPFFTTKSNGLGVGLTVCQSIVQAHEGRLWAEPNPEGGAIFRFALACVDATAAPASVRPT